MNDSVNPMISIIMPVYNCENFIAESIESVLAQQFSSWELIVIDDGSTDNSGKLCDAFSVKDPRIKVFHIENGGVSNARNYGVQQAQGEYIQFLDADDLLTPETLQTAYTNKGDCDLIIWGYERFPTKAIQRVENMQQYSTRKELTEVFPLLASNKLFNIPWNKLYKREIITRNDLRFRKGLSLGEDLLFNLSYAKVCKKIRVLPDVLYRYRYGENNTLSAKFYKDMMDIQRLLKDETDKTFNYNAEVVKWTRQAYLDYAIGHIKACACNDGIKRIQKIRMIKSCLNDEYFVANFNSDDLDSINVKQLMRILITNKCAYLIYLLCECKRVCNKFLNKEAYKR